MKKYFVCALAALSFTACVNEDGLLNETKGYINLNVNADNEMVVTRAEQTVSVCGSTPPLADITVTAPSNTLRERSTSTVKSTWPGVSMMLIR